MKQLFILILAVMPMCAFAAAPSTSCPVGYVSVAEEHMTIADSTCPSGYTSAGTADSCLVSLPTGSCIMYAPTNTEYSDSTGTYEYTAACPLE